MLKIVLIGADKIKHHYEELLKIPEKKLLEHLGNIAEVLKDNSELVLLPDFGACLELARKYKELGGKKCYALVPLQDKDFGIKRLESNMNMKIKNKKIFDEIIDTENWYKQDLTHGLYGDVILMLGTSLGSLGELTYSFYVYDILKGQKEGYNVSSQKINKNIIAGTKIPLTLIIYKPFIKSDLPLEIKEHIKKVGGVIYYAKDSEELKKIIVSIDKK
jgi:hypothetical protein